MWLGLFWICTGLLLASYAGYPLLLALLARLQSRTTTLRLQETAAAPRATLIIPAHNEEQVIADRLDNALGQSHPDLEIIVAMDGCTDRTEEIVRGYEERGVRHFSQPRSGKMTALNRAVDMSTGDILVFTDANVMFEPDAVGQLVASFEDPSVGCVCGEHRYESAGGRSASGEGEGLYWKYERLIKIWEGQLGAVLVTNGPIYAMRKPLFSPIDPRLADDFVNPIKAAAQGSKVTYCQDAIAWERLAEKSSEEFRRKRRIIAQGWIATAAMLSDILAGGPGHALQFALHKMIRWLGPVWLAGAMVASLAGMGRSPQLAVLALLQVAFYAAAGAGALLSRRGRIPKFLGIPYYYSIINLGAAAGLLDALTSRQRGVWETPESNRAAASGQAGGETE